MKPTWMATNYVQYSLMLTAPIISYTAIRDVQEVMQYHQVDEDYESTILADWSLEDWRILMSRKMGTVHEARGNWGRIKAIVERTWNVLDVHISSFSSYRNLHSWMLKKAEEQFWL